MYVDYEKIKQYGMTAAEILSSAMRWSVEQAQGYVDGVIAARKNIPLTLTPGMSVDYVLGFQLGLNDQAINEMPHTNLISEGVSV